MKCRYVGGKYIHFTTTNKHRCIIFHARVGQVRIPQKACRDTIRQTCVFPCIWICKSHTAFRWSMPQNVDALLFMLGLERYRFDKKGTETSHAKHVFLHPVGSVGYIVHFGASSVRNVDTLFFMLVWHQYRFHKKCTRIRYVELFYILYNLQVT
jgi:hypothetical protein